MPTVIEIRARAAAVAAAEAAGITLDAVGLDAMSGSILRAWEAMPPLQVRYRESRPLTLTELESELSVDEVGEDWNVLQRARETLSRLIDPGLRLPSVVRRRTTLEGTSVVDFIYRTGSRVVVVRTSPTTRVVLWGGNVLGEPLHAEECVAQVNALLVDDLPADHPDTIAAFLEKYPATAALYFALHTLCAAAGYPVASYLGTDPEGCRFCSEVQYLMMTVTTPSPAAAAALELWFADHDAEARHMGLTTREESNVWESGGARDVS